MGLTVGSGDRSVLARAPSEPGAKMCVGPPRLVGAALGFSLCALVAGSGLAGAGAVRGVRRLARIASMALSSSPALVCSHWLGEHAGCVLGVGSVAAEGLFALCCCLW